MRLLVILAMLFSFAVNADVTETEKAEAALLKIQELLSTDLDPETKVHLNKMKISYEKDIVKDKIVREVNKKIATIDIDEKIAIQNSRDLNLECAEMIAKYETEFMPEADLGKTIIVEVANKTGVDDTSSCYSRAKVYIQDEISKILKDSWVSHENLIKYFNAEVAKNIADLNELKSKL